MKYFSTGQWLTYIKICVRYFILKFNKPIVPLAGALPMELKKSIITLTLVISRESISPKVTLGTYMFNFFRIKTKLELQVEEYVNYKAKTSPFIAVDQKEILTAFVKDLKHSNVSEITLDNLDAYHKKLITETTQYATIRSMQAIRAFMRCYRKQTQIKPDIITNQGVKLQNVEENAIIKSMIRKRIGRPYGDIELIKKIKRLKDKEDVPFRKIGLIVGKDVSHVYRMYRYNLTKSLQNVE